MAICVKFSEEKAHALYPEASMIPAMKIWQLPKNKKDKLKEYCDSGDYLASLKIDGYHYMLNRTQNHVYLFSRSAGVNGLLTEKIANVPHLAKIAELLPPDTLIIGEIYVPGGTSKDVTRIMGCLPQKAIDRQLNEGNVYYYLHDIIMWDGQDLQNLPFEDRIEYLKAAYYAMTAENPIEFLQVAQYFEDNIYEKAMELIAAGEEGVVLKKKTATYQPDKRPAWSSIKIKPENTIDVVVTGFEEPTREYKGTEIDSWEYYENDEPVTKAYYYGWKNAIQISAYNQNGELQYIGTVSSGLTDELRADFAENPDKYLGKVAEIKCMSMDSKEHTLRHAYLVRFRDDKNAEDCTFAEIF